MLDVFEGSLFIGKRCSSVGSVCAIMRIKPVTHHSDNITKYSTVFVLF